MDSISRQNIIERINKVSGEQMISIDGTKLLLDKHTLVPHSDTLELIEIARDILQKNKWIKTIADIGTGSGLIAIKLGKAFSDKNIFGSDICANALHIATQNVQLNGLRNIHLLLNTNGVWLSEHNNRNIDFIISNPPFVSRGEYYSETFLASYPEVKLEPRQAILSTGTDGLDPYLGILRNSKNNKTRYYLFQCNSLNIHKLNDIILERFDGYKVSIQKNQSNSYKFLFIENPKV